MTDLFVMSLMLEADEKMEAWLWLDPYREQHEGDLTMTEGSRSEEVGRLTLRCW